MGSAASTEQYRGYWAQQPSYDSSVGEIDLLSHGQHDTEKKVGVGRLALCSWVAQKANKKMWCGSNSPVDRELSHIAILFVWRTTWGVLRLLQGEKCKVELKLNDSLFKQTRVLSG